MVHENVRPSLAENFNRAHAARLNSATLERIYREAFGADYPAETNPSAFFSMTTLRAVQTALRIGPGDTLVDLGCGHGGPGLWVIQQSGANLIGIDLSPVGVMLAQERAASRGLGERANFRVGDIAATGLPDSFSDAALSLDVLPFVPDKAAAMREVARILRPNGRFAFTTWEQSGYSPRLGTMQLADYRPILQAAGFTIEAYEQPMNWQHQQSAVVEGIIASEAELTKELGTASAAGLLAMARGALSDLPERRYVFGAARNGK